MGAPHREQIAGREVAHPGGEEVVAPPALVAVGEGPFERGAREVGSEDERVGGVDHRALGRPFEQRPRVAHEPLVELVVAGDEHREGGLAGPADAADLLPRGGDRAGEAVDDAGVEAADVDAELERGRADDAAQRPRRERAFDLAPLVGEVAGPVGPHRAGEHRRPALHLRGDDLGGAPAPTEGDHAVVVAGERRGEQRGLAVGGVPQAGELVGGGLQQGDGALALRGRVVGDGHDGRAAQGLGELGRRADRGGAEDEHGPRAVLLAEPSEAAEHVREVRAEHAAEAVHLVDDDEPQAHEERRPARVVGQQPAVEHLGVGEHDVGLRAGERALGGGGVAVVDRGADAGEVVPRERAELVVRERLGRADHERRRGADGIEEGLREGHLVAERLARPGARGDDHVATGAHVLDRLDLVGPERGDAEAVGDRIGQGATEVGGAAPDGAPPLDRDDATVGDERVEHVGEGHRGASGDGGRRHGDRPILRGGNDIVVVRARTARRGAERRREAIELAVPQDAAGRLPR